MDAVVVRARGGRGAVAHRDVGKRRPRMVRSVARWGGPAGRLWTPICQSSRAERLLVRSHPLSKMSDMDGVIEVGCALVEVVSDQGSEAKEDSEHSGRLGEPPEQVVDSTQAEMDDLHAMVAQTHFNVKKRPASRHKHKKRSWEAAQHARTCRTVKKLRGQVAQSGEMADALHATLHALNSVGVPVVGAEKLLGNGWLA